MERTHEPCVPTYLLPANHPAIRLILKFNIQSSKFKVQAPTSPAWPFCRATCPEWFCNLHGITRQIILFFYHIGLAIGKF